MVKVSTAVQIVGYYSWDFSDNLVRIDSVCAAIFDFDRRESATGLPIEAFIAKMDRETQTRIAEAIYKSIIEDSDYDETYPISYGQGGQRWVRVQGRCMMTEAALPTHSAGTMIDVTHLRASF